MSNERRIIVPAIGDLVRGAAALGGLVLPPGAERALRPDPPGELGKRPVLSRSERRMKYTPTGDEYTYPRRFETVGQLRTSNAAKAARKACGVHGSRQSKKWRREQRQSGVILASSVPT